MGQQILVKKAWSKNKSEKKIWLKKIFGSKQSVGSRNFELKKYGVNKSGFKICWVWKNFINNLNLSAKTKIPDKLPLFDNIIQS